MEICLIATGGNCEVGMAPSGDITDKGASFPKTVPCGTPKSDIIRIVEEELKPRTPFSFTGTYEPTTHLIPKAIWPHSSVSARIAQASLSRGHGLKPKGGGDFLARKIYECMIVEIGI